jgi:hypothetical protein
MDWAIHKVGARSKHNSAALAIASLIEDAAEDGIAPDTGDKDTLVSLISIQYVGADYWTTFILSGSLAWFYDLLGFVWMVVDCIRACGGLWPAWFGIEIAKGHSLN